MVSEFQDILNRNQPARQKTVAEYVSAFFPFFPYVGLSAGVAIVAAFLYLRVAVPVFQANTFINVKAEISKGGVATNVNAASNDILNSAMYGGRTAVNLDNELSRLRSTRLMEKVIRNGSFNVQYFKEGRFRNFELEHDKPVRLYAVQINDSSDVIRFTLGTPDKSGVWLSINDQSRNVKVKVKWGRPFRFGRNIFSIQQLRLNWTELDKHFVTWTPVMRTVNELVPELSANIVGKTSNIKLSLNVENAQRGEAILDLMVAEFIQMSLDDQNKAARDKITFINERLDNLSRELKSIEIDLARYAGANKLVNGEDGGIIGMAPLNSDNAIAQLRTQFEIIKIIRKELDKNTSTYQVLPSPMIFEDPVLARLIEKYNSLVIEQDKILGQVANTGLEAQAYQAQLIETRKSISPILDNIYKSIEVQLASITKQEEKYLNALTKIPEKTRVYGDIARERTAKETLYLYLLQEREEAAISRSTSTPYEQIDHATSFGPIAPNHTATFLYAFIIGAIIPILIILAKQAVFGIVSDPASISAALGVPALAHVSLNRRNKERMFAASVPGISSEEFRNLRMNLGLLNKNKGVKTVLVTSYKSGEGKSFIASNLAMVIAKLNKKVALVIFDVRKPLSLALPEYSGKGITEYLTGATSLHSIVTPIPALPSLHLYSSGRPVENIADFLVGDKVEEMFQHLKANYEYIIIDTAPVGMFSDALILQKYADSVLYVVRQGMTDKVHLDKGKILFSSKKLIKPSLIINGVRSETSSYYYNYNYYAERKQSWFSKLFGR